MESRSPSCTFRSPLPWRQKLSYSVGHVLNDLCASMWFTYLLLYFHFVLGFSNSLSGIVLLIGQLADAIATPFVGLESDRANDCFLCRYGRRKTWHLFGTLCVICSFPFLFTKCIDCEHSSPEAQLVYYAAFVVIFQFGWASTQISHLSMIPDLTDDPNERTELNALRYAFTVVSNIFVYGVTWVVFGLHGSVGHHDNEKIGPEDAYKFQHIVLIVTAVGSTLSLTFHLGVKEQNVFSVVTVQNEAVEAVSCLVSNGERHKSKMEWHHWMKEVYFYQVALLYMFTRLFVNMTQVFIPLYLQDTLKLREECLAIIPLTMFVAGFLSSFFMKLLNKNAGREVTYFFGVLIGLGACIWIYFGRSENYVSVQLFIVAALLGIGSSTVLITSLSITADLIGNNVESGAFVYGAMSFTDKLSNGFAIMLIQYYHPCEYCCNKCANYYTYVLSFGCGGAAVAALIVVFSLYSRRLSTRNNSGGYLTCVVITEIVKAIYFSNLIYTHLQQLSHCR